MSTSLRFRFVAVALLVFALPALPAHAVSKEMIQLQQQIQDLQNAVAKLQQSNDERMGVLKDLVQQTADSVNKMSVTVGGLQQQIATTMIKANADAEKSSVLTLLGGQSGSSTANLGAGVGGNLDISA